MGPYQKVGGMLKAHRQAASKTIQDVSDAVEIEPAQLGMIEDGQIQPPEEILQLLISHFAIDPQDAIRLREMAGYTGFDEFDDFMSEDNSKNPKEINVNIPSDQQILYTDMVHVVANKYGVTLNFIQGVGPSGKPTVVSRVGMSKEHAQSILDVLQKSLSSKD